MKMNLTKSWWEVVFVACLISAACAMGKADRLNYNTFKAYSLFPNEAYDEIGPISATGWSHYVGFCGNAARKALANALEIAKARDGNALANVRWIFEGAEYKTPVCTNFFFFYYWGSKAEVSATAISIKPMPIKGSGIFYFDKKKPLLKEADRILAEIINNGH